MYKKILLICFLFSLMLLIPKNKFNEETSYVSSEKKLSYIYLLDNNNYLAKTDIQVKDEIKDLIQDMKDTLNSDSSGVGISAVQIGALKRVCVLKYDNKEYT